MSIFNDLDDFLSLLFNITSTNDIYEDRATGFVKLANYWNILENFIHYVVSYISDTDNEVVIEAEVVANDGSRLLDSKVLLKILRS